MGDLQRDQSEFVVFRFVSRECLGCTRTQAIQVAADLLERPESEIGHAGSQQERGEDRRNREIHRVQEARCDFTLEKHRGNPGVDRAEGRSVELQREAHVVNDGGAVYQAKLFPGVSGRDRVKIRPWGSLLAHQLGIGMEECFAVRVHHGRIVDEGPKCHLGFEIVQKIGIHRQVFGERAAHRRGVIGIDGGAAQVRQIIFSEVGQLLSQAAGAFVGIGDALTKNLRNIEIRERSHHHGHHEGDAGYDDGFASHGIEQWPVFSG